MAFDKNAFRRGRTVYRRLLRAQGVKFVSQLDVTPEKLDGLTLNQLRDMRVYAAWPAGSHGPAGRFYRKHVPVIDGVIAEVAPLVRLGLVRAEG